jgi:signal transduction histidine kinase
MMCMRASSIIAWGLLCLAMPRGGWADVRITGVSVDGRSVPITQEAASGADQGTVRITSTSRQITFAFEGEGFTAAAPAGALPPDALPPPRGTRLRFRLDGHDRDWRDRPANGRVMLRFIDTDGQTVGSDETALPGETAGWQGFAETSPLSPSSFSAVAPPLANRAVVNFVSGYEQVVGAMGFDNVTITVTSPSGAPVEHAVPSDGLGDSPHPLATPAGWGRSGSRGELSRIARRSTAGGQPILTVLDDDPRQYGSWATKHGSIAVEPGDSVTVSWRASHSFGAGGSLEASYNSLPPGEYRFRVSACLPGGQPTGAEASLRIVVIAPWYHRADVWLAIGLSAVAGAAMAARQITLRRLRRRLEAVEQANALERERARIARDLHDEVGAGLTEIAMQTAWLQRDMAQSAPPEIVARAEKACQAAIDLTRSVDAIVWAVNPANDTLDRFVSYLTHATEQFTDAAGLAVRFGVPAHLPAVPLPGPIRHGLFLIVREAVNNAVKHAQCQLIRLSVQLDHNNLLTITVEDDGRGFAPTDPNRLSLGLESMHQRAADLGGTLTISPQPAGGTRVAIAISVPTSPAG